MQRPKFRFSLRNIMLAIAVLAVPLTALTEEARRRNLAVSLERDQATCEQKAMELYRQGKAFYAEGHREEAARMFTSSSFWAGQAESHGRMKREYQRTWWLPRF